MFYNQFISLCEKAGKKPYSVTKALGIKSTSIIEQWKKGSVPRQPMLEKIAEHFNVSIDYLLTGEEKQPAVADGLSADEINLIEAFRDIPDAEKQTFLRMIQQYVKHTP